MFFIISRANSLPVTLFHHAYLLTIVNFFMNKSNFVIQHHLIRKPSRNLIRIRNLLQKKSSKIPLIDSFFPPPLTIGAATNWQDRYSCTWNQKSGSKGI